jgi:stage III sporulation protein AB
MRQDIKGRLILLRQIKKMLCDIEAEISFQSTPIGRIIAKLANGSGCSVLYACRDLMLKGEHFKAAWETALLGDCTLDMASRDRLMPIGQIGLSDKESQLKQIGELKYTVDEMLLTAGEELESKGKLMATCGVLCGIALIIIIL